MEKSTFNISTLALITLLVSFGISGFAYASSMEAERHMARGAAAMEVAKIPADYLDAVGEFSQVVKLVPDWADAWYNLGTAQESAEKYRGAIKSFQTYLNKSTNASDRKAVQTRIFGLEYKMEKAQKREETQRQTAVISDGTFVSEQGAPMMWVLDLEVRNERFSLKQIGIYWKGKVEPRSARLLFEGTIENDYSLRGDYIQETIDGWVKDVDSPIGYASEVFTYNKRTPMTGQVSDDGQSLVLQFTRFRYRLPTREDGKKYGRKLELKMRRLR